MSRRRRCQRREVLYYCVVPSVVMLIDALLAGLFCVDGACVVAATAPKGMASGEPCECTSQELEYNMRAACSRTQVHMMVQSSSGREGGRAGFAQQFTTSGILADAISRAAQTLPPGLNSRLHRRSNWRLPPLLELEVPSAAQFQASPHTTRTPVLRHECSPAPPGPSRILCNSGKTNLFCFWSNVPAGKSKWDRNCDT